MKWEEAFFPFWFLKHHTPLKIKKTDEVQKKKTISLSHVLSSGPDRVKLNNFTYISTQFKKTFDSLLHLIWHNIPWTVETSQKQEIRLSPLHTSTKESEEMKNAEGVDNQHSRTNKDCFDAFKIQDFCIRFK